MSIRSYLLSIANRSPPTLTRTEFYELKSRLLKRYGIFRGHQIQEISKACYGPRKWSEDWGEYDYDGCLGPTCPRCGGTGIFDIRWIRLERWTWGRYVFHVPSGDTRIKPDPYPPVDMIRGRIEHGGSPRASEEAALWLYLLCGEWRLWWRECGGWNCSCAGYPMLHLRRIVAKVRMRFSRHTCWCGKRFWTWGSGWRICPVCRKQNATDEMPF